MRRRISVYIALLLCALLCAGFCGCMSANIHEDEIRDDLPVLDPQAGLAKSIEVVCYYQLLREPWLYGVQRTIEVHANERTEHAIVSALLEGAQDMEGLNGLFPAGTSIVDISMDGGILYVTLSKGFMDESALRRALNELENAQSQQRYTQEEYDALVTDAKNDALQSRRLAMYSLVNTLTGYDEDMRVMLLIEQQNTGMGERMLLADLGIQAENAQATLLSPLSFVPRVVKTEADTVDLALAHIKAGEYEAAYSLFADVSADNTAKPQMTDFQSRIRALGVLQSYTVNEMHRDADGELLSANVDVTFTAADGVSRTVTGLYLPLRKQGVLYKLDYAACAAAWGGMENAE